MDTSVDLRDADRERFAREQAERLLGCLQKAIGHELPNQLVAIQGLARVIDMDLPGNVNDETRGHLQRLASVVRRTDEFVRAVAQVGRWCRDPGPVVPVILAETAREAAAEVKLAFPEVALEYDGLMDLPAVKAPRAAVYQVFVQLFRNAAQAPASGRPPHIAAAGQVVTGGLEISVSDNGIGIGTDQQRQLFEPFAGDRATGRIGLGLFLVRQLVCGWGGAVRIQSQAGHGTTVTFLAPASGSMSA